MLVLARLDLVGLCLPAATRGHPQSNLVAHGFVMTMVEDRKVELVKSGADQTAPGVCSIFVTAAVLAFS